MISAKEALNILREGNREYLTSIHGKGDISEKVRIDTAKNGQHPFAVVVSCSDSRVIPEEIFSCGIGELFVIRVAGNVVGDHELGSIEYALEHLGCHLVVVLGHTSCGAVSAAIHHESDGHIRYLIDDIELAIGSEEDDVKASCLNAHFSADRIDRAFRDEHPEDREFTVCAALYHIDTGVVDFEV